jgi:hypothetical protein
MQVPVCQLFVFSVFWAGVIWTNGMDNPLRSLDTVCSSGVRITYNAAIGIPTLKLSEEA